MGICRDPQALSARACYRISDPCVAPQKGATQGARIAFWSSQINDEKHGMGAFRESTAILKKQGAGPHWFNQTQFNQTWFNEIRLN